MVNRLFVFVKLDKMVGGGGLALFRSRAWEELEWVYLGIQMGKEGKVMQWHARRKRKGLPIGSDTPNPGLQ